MKITVTKNIAFLLFASVCLSANAHGQDVDGNESTTLINEEKNPSVFEFAFGVPDSPALSLAGLEANETTKIDELQDFIIALPEFSRSEKALAIDFNPANILVPISSQNDTLEFYQSNDNRVYRMLNRTRMSMLVREGKIDADDPSKSVKSLLSIGLTTSILDSSDPLYAFSIDKIRACEAYTLGAVEFIEGIAPSSLTENGKQINGHVDNARAVLSGSPNLEFARDNIAQAYNLIDQANISYTQINLNSNQVTLLAEVEKLSKFVLDNFKIKKKPETQEEARKLVVKAKDTCYKAVANALYYKPNLDIGAALLWRGTQDGLGQLNPGGQAIWASYRKPIRFQSKTAGASKSYFVVGATGRAGLGEFATTGDMVIAEAKADTYQGWIGAELFSDTWRVAGQVGYIDVNFNSAINEQFSRNGERWQVSTDYKVADNIFLGVSYGKAQGTIDALDGERLTVDVKFQQSKAFNIFGLK